MTSPSHPPLPCCAAIYMAAYRTKAIPPPRMSHGARSKDGRSGAGVGCSATLVFLPPSFPPFLLSFLLPSPSLPPTILPTLPPPPYTPRSLSPLPLPRARTHSLPTSHLFPRALTPRPLPLLSSSLPPFPPLLPSLPPSLPPAP